MSGIVRVEKNANYTVMNRTALNDKRLSWKAKGIIAYMLSMPDDWVFYMDELMTHATDGKTSFQNGMKELKACGYVERRPVREGQRIKEWETIVHEVPINSLQTDFLQVENLEVQKQEVGFVQVENEPLLSTDYLLSTESTNNNNDDDKGMSACAAEEQKPKSKPKEPNAFEFYQANGFGALGSFVRDKMFGWIDDLSEPLVIRAMEKAVTQGKNNWGYVETILKDWSNKKLLTIEAVEAEDLRWEAQKQQKQSRQQGPYKQGRTEKLPEWFENRNKKSVQAPVAEPLAQSEKEKFEEGRRKVLQKLGKIPEE